MAETVMVSTPYEFQEDDALQLPKFHYWYATPRQKVQSDNLLDETTLAWTLAAHNNDFGKLNIRLETDVPKPINEGDDWP